MAKKKNNGLESEDLFAEMIEKRYGKKQFAYKVVDTKSAGKIVKSAPADWVLTADGHMSWAEVKSCSHETSFPFKNFTHAQMRGMIRQAAAGGQYKIFIHRIQTNEWFQIGTYEVLSRIEEGRKSITWKELANFKF